MQLRYLGPIALLVGCAGGTDDYPATTDTGTGWTPPYYQPDTAIAEDTAAEEDTGPAAPLKGSMVLPFRPSNVAAQGLAYEGDIIIDLPYCIEWQIDTDAGKIQCRTSSGWNNYAKTFKVVDQGPSVPKLGVFLVRQFIFDDDRTIGVVGGNALVIVAQDLIKITGKLDLAANGRKGGAGGYGWIEAGNGPGKGWDGGGGGAGHCGAGGAGAPSSAGTFGDPGVAYGAASLMPLVGGSSGGMAAAWYGGGGGGAVQLVSATKIEIGSRGVVSAGGGGGYRACLVGGAGGGSGGAILLEAPEIGIRGKLVANGGAGGGAFCSSSEPLHKDANEDATPAKDGGMSGAGGAANLGALPGQVPVRYSDNGPGGGGGARGRIRIHTKSGSAAIDSSAIISPTLGSECAGQATLRP